MAMLAQDSRFSAWNALWTGSGYRAADSESRTMKDADDQIRTTRDDANIVSRHLGPLRDRSRALFRNEGYARAAVGTGSVHTIGSGLRFQSRIDREFLNLDDDTADELEVIIEREWNTFWNATESDGRRILTGGEQERLAFETAFISGESFATIGQLRSNERGDWPYKMYVSQFEGDHVRNPYGKINGPRLHEGIELDSRGAPVAIHYAKQHPGAGYFSPDSYNTVRIPIRGPRSGSLNVLHVYKMIRPGQYRGEPWLAAVVEPIVQLTKYKTSEVYSAILDSMRTFALKRDLGAGSIYEDENERGEILNPLSYGGVLELDEGEDIINFNPARPNPNFSAFLEGISVEIGSALGYGSETIRGLFSGSFSASRAAMHKAWRFMLVDRLWIATRFNKPILTELITESVLQGRIRLPGFLDDYRKRMAYLAGDFIGPAQTQLDPAKEALAWQIMVAEGWATDSEATTALTGGDFDSKLRRRRREIKKKREAGLIENPTKHKVSIDTNSNPDKADENATDNSSNIREGIIVSTSNDEIVRSMKRPEMLQQLSLFKHEIMAGVS